MSFDPTEADIEWMTAHALKLRTARLKSLGHGAKLCEEEEDRILAQALTDGEAHALKVRREEEEERQRVERFRADEALRAEGKPTLRASFGELVLRGQKR